MVYYSIEYRNRDTANAPGTESFELDDREFKNAIYEQFALVGAAFASPKRVELVDLLAQGERSVESIAAASGMTVANTSRHLQVLRNAGMVASRRDGLRVIYRLVDNTVITGFLALRSLAEDRVAQVHALAGAFFTEVDGAQPLDMAELAARAASGEVVIVDVRPTLEFEAGHLPGAISIPLERLADQITELSRDRLIVAYCRGPYCVLAAHAVAQLRAAGLQAQRLASGPPEWRTSGVTLAVGAVPKAADSSTHQERQHQGKGSR